MGVRRSGPGAPPPCCEQGWHARGVGAPLQRRASLCLALLLAFVGLPCGGSTAGLAACVRPSAPRVLFSDIDGTIVHYGIGGFLKHGVEKVSEDTVAGVGVLRDKTGQTRTCRLVPSSKMGSGYISLRTVELIERVRDKGIKFAMVSGARTTTMMKRLAALPAADAVVCETGSAIYFPHASDSGEVEWRADSEWRERMAAVVGDQADPLPPPEERQGALWDLYRKYLAEGLETDARGYCASFRVYPRNASEEAYLQTEREALEGTKLSCKQNLGHYDFMSAAAGKGNAVEYLQSKWGLCFEDSAAMFDDDNDLSMAAKCRWCLLPSLTSPSVVEALGDNPHWLPSDSCGAGVFACEEALERIVENRLPAGGHDEHVRSPVVAERTDQTQGGAQEHHGDAPAEGGADDARPPPAHADGSPRFDTVEVPEGDRAEPQSCFVGLRRVLRMALRK